MTLDALIHIVDDAYPDGLVWQYFTDPTTKGDGLAQFMMTEIRDNFDAEAPDVAQLTEAIRVIGTAFRELDNVITELEIHRDKYCFVIVEEDETVKRELHGLLCTTCGVDLNDQCLEEGCTQENDHRAQNNYCTRHIPKENV